MLNKLIYLSSLPLEGGNPSTVQLLPPNNFRTRDGRPQSAKAFKINATIAQKLINQVNSQGDDVLIDYDHQTLNTAKNGRPAPAAGWFKSLKWIEGPGLFAMGVKWTDKAAQLIKSKEYRYISPVISFDSISGEITGIAMAAIVNFPAIDGMAPLTAASAQIETTALSAIEINKPHLF